MNNNDLSAYLLEQQRVVRKMTTEQQPPVHIGCQVTHSADQSINTATLTALSFDTDVYNAFAMHDTAVQNDRITVVYDGWYVATGGVFWAANSTGRRQLVIRRNGSLITIALQMAITDAAVGTLHMLTSGAVYCSAGDYFQLYALQASGGALNSTSSAANKMPQFTVWKVL